VGRGVGGRGGCRVARAYARRLGTTRTPVAVKSLCCNHIADSVLRLRLRPSQCARKPSRVRGPFLWADHMSEICSLVKPYPPVRRCSSFHVRPSTTVGVVAETGEVVVVEERAAASNSRSRRREVGGTREAAAVAATAARRRVGSVIGGA